MLYFSVPPLDFLGCFMLFIAWGNLCVHFSTEVVKGSGDLIPKTVKIWVERYEVLPKLATTELLSMLFEVVNYSFNISHVALI